MRFAILLNDASTRQVALIEKGADRDLLELLQISNLSLISYAILDRIFGNFDIAHITLSHKKHKLISL